MPNEPLDAAMVIAPLPLVMVTFVPAVSAALVSVLPVVLPINNCPLVKVVSPVPPLATGSVPVTPALSGIFVSVLLAPLMVLLVSVVVLVAVATLLGVMIPDRVVMVIPVLGFVQTMQQAAPSVLL